MKIRKLIIALMSVALLLTVAVQFGVAQEVEKSEAVGISGAMGFVVEWIETDSSSEKGGLKGFIVESVKSGSPAEKAGIKRGDAILSLDGRRVQSIQDIEYAFRNSLNNPDEQIAGVYLRYEPTTGRHVIIKTEQMNASLTKPISGGVLNEKTTEKPLPTYPPIAKAARASGLVAVRVVVDEDGRVEKAKAISGHPLLQAAAVEAAYHARFSPTKLSGNPVKVSGVLTYNFTLP